MKKIFNLFKVHKKAIIALSVIVYIAIPILPFIKSPIGFVLKDDAIIFLEYYATIISGITGGALTLGGVWWTIVEQKNDLKEQQKRLDDQRREDLVIQYKPIIIIKNTKVKEIAEGLNVIFTFENQGRGEATNVEFLTFLANNRDEYMSSQFSTKRQIIPQNQKSHFSLMILRIDKTKSHNIKAGEITALLPIERNKFGFTACFSYCNPIDNTKKYFLTFDFYVEKAVIGDEIYKLESFQQSIDDLKKEWIVTTENIKYKS